MSDRPTRLPSSSAGTYSATRITKQFGPVTVLRGIDVTLHPGRIHTMMGENGAGKSTLFKILAGLTRPSSGELRLDREMLTLATPLDAHRRGIYLVPQEPALMPELSVAETMFAGWLPTHRLWPHSIDWTAIRSRAQEALGTLGLDIDVGQPARLLSIAQQQQVECAKALLRGCRILLFDEPTSPLTTHEVERLFGIMRRLRDDGCTIAFISHRMEEVMEISDDISILRDGNLVDTSERPDFNRARILSQMVGREMRVVPRRAQSFATPRAVLQVEHLCNRQHFEDIGLVLHAGEVLGFAGLVGAGRTEIAETILGLRRRDAGRVLLKGEDITGLRTRDIIRKGLVYVPEDRARHGAVLPMTITENLTSGRLERLEQRFGMIRQTAEDRIGIDAVTRFRVRCAGIDQPVRELSGGNQQKVVFGKWMGLGPDVAILDEPTRGVDVGAKDEIYELIEELAEAGLAILVISSEMEELVRLCDRILSIYEGRIVCELSGDEITPDRVGQSYLGEAAGPARTAVPA